MKKFTPTFEEFLNEARGPELLNPAMPSKNFFKGTDYCDIIKKVIDKPFIAAYKEFVESGKVTAKTNYRAVQARNALIAFYDISLAMLCNRKDDYIEYKRNTGSHQLTKVANDRIWAMESFAYELSSKRWSDDMRRNLTAITATDLKKLMNSVKDILLKEIQHVKDAAVRQKKGVFDLNESLNEKEYIVVWVDRDYKEHTKKFKDDPQGAPENGLVKAKKFMKKLNDKDAKDKYGLYRSISLK